MEVEANTSNAKQEGTFACKKAKASKCQMHKQMQARTAKLARQEASKYIGKKAGK